MKIHALYVCRLCGTSAPRWQGRCGGCAEWNSLDEVTNRHVATSERTAVVALADVGEEGTELTPSGVGELDRVLGGGFVAGSTTLLYGEPGVG